APLAALAIMHEPIMPVEPATPKPVAIARVVDKPAPAASVSGARAPRRPQSAAAASSLHLGSILFGPDRKLATIDGRIVEAGDDVGGAMVVEISPTTVTLRDRMGRFQKLSLGGR